MEFGYVYETGKRRYNEDALLLRSSLFAGGELVVAAVCDGMGGMQDGIEASYLCIREMEEWFDTQLLSCIENCGKKPQKLKKAIRSKGFMLFQQMNRKLFEQMRKDGKASGTTATMCVIYKEYYYLFHIGDSRAYQIKKRCVFHGMKLMTKEHGTKKGLSKCLGLNREWKPDFISGKLQGVGFLLCTDGFWRKYDKRLWKRCLNPSKMSDESAIMKRLKSIADYNTHVGESDNISAIYVSF